METIMKALEEYFTKPLAQSACFYPDARLLEVRDGNIRYGTPHTAQPLGAGWTLFLADWISPQLCYAHVGYIQGEGYRHEALTFLGLDSGWKLVSVLRAETPAQYASIFAAPDQEREALEAISGVLLAYCDGVYNLDADQALSVFDEGARMVHPVDGARFADVSCKVFRERWAGLPHPQTLGIPQYAHIWHIELLNKDTAIAKVGVAKLNDHFNDYLFCLKAGGRWRIAHKLTQSVWLRPES